MRIMINILVCTIVWSFISTIDLYNSMCWKFDGVRKSVDYPEIHSPLAQRSFQYQNHLNESPNVFLLNMPKKH